MPTALPFTLCALRDAYAGGLSPEDVIREAYRRIEAAGDDAIFLHLPPLETAAGAARELGDYDPALPLWGVPFVVKDNIDVAGMPTTAACPAFEYMAQTDAFAVAQLRAAGALPLGKTNLDQFATGLVGVRSPYGVPRNALDPQIVPGGSSSGSAVAVARGICCFGLGTDTAGSGRVPAALNDIVGLKPTVGALSATGMVPACRTLDTISIFALTVGDAWAAFQAACAYDAADAYSRPVPAPALSAPPASLRIGVPDAPSIEFFGDDVQAESFCAALELLRAQGAEIVPLDFTPFYDVAQMLYEGAWVAERYAAVEPLIRETPEALHPTTRQIIGGAEALSAADAFRGMYRLKSLARIAEAALDRVDGLCVPTIPTFYSVADLEADPIGPNSRFGTYTNFVNLLDMCGIAAPVGPRADGRPGSVTLLARAGRDAFCAALAQRLEQATAGTRRMGATGWPVPAAEPPAPAALPGEIAVAVCGAHMSGLPLNDQLTSRGGRLLRAARSAPCYRLHALAGGPPARPGMLRVAEGGAALELEVWALPEAAFGSFMAGIPAPLSIGTVLLEDGGAAHGFLVEQAGLEGAEDITAFGGWRGYLAAQ